MMMRFIWSRIVFVDVSSFGQLWLDRREGLGDDVDGDGGKSRGTHFCRSLLLAFLLVIY
jgi:hypothetical protein